MVIERQEHKLKELEDDREVLDRLLEPFPLLYLALSIKVPPHFPFPPSPSP